MAEERLVGVLDAGLDPDLAVVRVRRAQRDLVRAESVLGAHDGGAAPALCDQRVRQSLEELGGLRGLLRGADAHERQRLCEAAGLRVRYRRDEAGRA